MSLKTREVLPPIVSLARLKNLLLKISSFSLDWESLGSWFFGELLLFSHQANPLPPGSLQTLLFLLTPLRRRLPRASLARKPRLLPLRPNLPLHRLFPSHLLLLPQRAPLLLPLLHPTLRCRLLPLLPIRQVLPLPQVQHPPHN